MLNFSSQSLDVMSADSYTVWKCILPGQTISYLSIRKPDDQDFCKADVVLELHWIESKELLINLKLGEWKIMWMKLNWMLPIFPCVGREGEEEGPHVTSREKPNLMRIDHVSKGGNRYIASQQLHPSPIYSSPHLLSPRGLPPKNKTAKTPTRKQKPPTTAFISPYPIFSFNAPANKGPTVNPALNTIELIA